MSAEIATTSWRATALGAVLTAAMSVAAWAWWQAALTHAYAVWSAGGPVPVLEGTTTLVQLAAAAVWTVLTLSVAMGTAAVLPVTPAAGSCAGQAWPPGGRVLASRVAAALLAATLGGPASSSATASSSAAASLSAAASSSATAAPVTRAAQSDLAAVDEDDSSTEPPDDVDTAQIPVPGWLPAPPPDAPAADVTLVSRGTPEDPMLTVRRGDTLWSIAADHLPGSPTVEQVAESWPRWYAANQDVIGPDPHLILPGQQLRAPAASLRSARP